MKLQVTEQTSGLLKLRLCLAGSGGGHVRQLLDLEPVWSQHDSFFVTEDTALGRSLALEHRVHLVEHYAAGQAKLGSPLLMLRGALRNLLQTVRVIWLERPDVVITTGAGAMFWTVLLGRLSGARVVLIESFARFNHPSKFARMAAPLATCRIVQSEGLKNAWPGVRVFDPLRVTELPVTQKQPLVFATVGATLPYPRLVDYVMRLKASGQLPERVILQIGATPWPDPMPGVEIVDELSFEDVKAILKDANLVVCHGGTGSIITALREGCRVISIPRRFDLKEHYDGHQEEITEAFQARGLIEVVRDESDLDEIVARAKARPAVAATTDPSALLEFLRERLASWACDK